MISKTSNPKLVRWVDYFCREVFEMLWFHSASKGGMNTFIMNEEFSLTEIELCIEGRPDEVILPKPIDSDFMSRASYFLFFGQKL